jgi:heat shock protein HslJ
MLVAFKDYGKDYFVKKNCYLDLTNKERASAKMGCNSLSFKYKINDSKINFTNGISTRMACEDMNLENDFSKTILEMNSFSIKTHQLILTSKAGQKMIFVAQDWD